MALYNNGYPMSYPQYYPQPNVYQPQISSQLNQQNQNGIIWVQGEAGAKSYLVAPNTTVQLWDSESQTIYLKSADASGMPNIKTLDYTIRDTPRKMQDTASVGNFATMEDINSLKVEIRQIKEELDHVRNDEQHTVSV